MLRICFVILCVISLQHLCVAENIEQSLGTLSQSLELLSKSIAPVKKVAKKDAWINPACFAIEGQKIKFDMACGNVEEWTFEKFKVRARLSELMNKSKDILNHVFFKLGLPNSDFAAYDFELPQKTWSAAGRLESYKWSSAINHYVSNIYKNGFVERLILGLFYAESIEPGSWNDNFDSEIKDKNLKEKWNQFMNEFREKMKAEGWKP